MTRDADAWDAAKSASAGAQHREGDLRLLRDLLAGDLRDYEREAFGDMLGELESPSSDGGFFALTAERRSWARKVAKRIGTLGYENLVSTGRVPRGKEVPTPAVLLNLPKKPPGRP